MRADKDRSINKDLPNLLPDLPYLHDPRLKMREPAATRIFPIASAVERDVLKGKQVLNSRQIWTRIERMEADKDG